MAERIGIDLFGRTFTFETRADAGEARLAKEFVEGEVARVMSRMGGDVTGRELQAVVLAALSIAGDYLDLKKNHEAFRETVGERMARLSRKLAGPGD